MGNTKVTPRVTVRLRLGFAIHQPVRTHTLMRAKDNEIATRLRQGLGKDGKVTGRVWRCPEQYAPVRTRTHARAKPFTLALRFAKDLPANGEVTARVVTG